MKCRETSDQIQPQGINVVLTVKWGGKRPKEHFCLILFIYPVNIFCKVVWIFYSWVLHGMATCATTVCKSCCVNLWRDVALMNSLAASIQNPKKRHYSSAWLDFGWAASWHLSPQDSQLLTRARCCSSVSYMLFKPSLMCFKVPSWRYPVFLQKHSSLIFSRILHNLVHLTV